MSRLIDLPPELLLPIVDLLSDNDLRALICCSRAHAHVFVHHLYDRQLRVPNPPNVVWTTGVKRKFIHVPLIEYRGLHNFARCWQSEHIIEYFKNYFLSYSKLDLEHWVVALGCSNNGKLIRALVESGLDLSHELPYGGMLLSLSFDDKDLETFYYLLAAGADPLYREDKNTTYALLLNAICFNSPDTLQFVMDVIQTAGGVIDIRGADGWAMLDKAIYYGARVTKYILELGVDPVRDGNFDNRLLAASDRIDTTKILWEAMLAMTDADAKRYGGPALRSAVWQSEEVTCLLVGYGVDAAYVEDPNYFPPSPFAHAVLSNHRAIVGKMLDCNPALWKSSHLQDAFGYIFQAYTGKDFHPALLLDLIASGRTNVDISLPLPLAPFGSSALHLLTEYSNEQEYRTALKFFRILVELGADIFKERDDGKTPLHVAVLRRGIYTYIPDPNAFAEILLSACPPSRIVELLNKRDHNGCTALHLAVGESGNFDSWDSLVSRGADINASDLKGKTPAHYAAKYSPSRLQILLEAGADPRAEDNDGVPSCIW